VNQLQAEMIKVRHAMKVNGGSFMQSLADTMIYADAENLAKIKNTWRKEWDNYIEIYNLTAQRNGREKSLLDEGIANDKI